MTPEEAPPERLAPTTDARPQDAVWPAVRWPPDPRVTLIGRVVEVAVADPLRDGGELFTVLDDDRVWQHVPGRPSSAQEWSERIEERLAAGALPWVVRARHSSAGAPAGSVLGTSSYLDVSDLDARLEIGSTAYTPQVWGTAVNPDTKAVLLAHAFEVLGMGRVQLKTDVRNTRSQAAITRLGASYEGTLRRYQRRADGTVRDTVLFSHHGRGLATRAGPPPAAPRRPGGLTSQHPDTARASGLIAGC